MPTRAGMTTMAFGLVCLAAGRVFGIFELYIVAAVMLALVACAVVWVTLNARSLTATRAVNAPRVHVGDSSVVTLTLTNRRVLPTPVARVTDEVDGTPRADANVPPLPRNRVTRASYRIAAERRGIVSLGPILTEIADPFALASISRRCAPDAAILALPAYDIIVAPPRPSGRLGARPDRAPGRIGAHGDEFSSLRSYVVGDDLRKVHWPSTAKADDLVVRTEHVPEQGHSILVLDVRQVVAEPDTFERMVSAATSILIASAERGDSMRLVATDGHQRIVDNAASLESALDDLALISQSAETKIDLTAAVRSNTAETAVMVLGRRAELELSPRADHGLPPHTLVVQFLDDGARPSTDPGALRSSRMTSVPSTERFCDVWAQLVGAVPAGSAQARS